MSRLADMLLDCFRPMQEKVAAEKAAKEAKEAASEKSTAELAHIKELNDRAEQSRALLQKVVAIERRMGIESSKETFDRWGELRRQEVDAQRREEIRKLERKAQKRARKAGA